MVEQRRRHVHPHRIPDGRDPVSHLGLNVGSDLHVPDGVRGVELQAPRGEEVLELRLARNRRQSRDGRRHVRFRVRVHEHEGVSAAEDELVDGVANRLGQPLRVHHHEHVHVVLHPFEARGGEVPHLEQLLDPLEDEPRLGRPAHHHRLAALAVEGQGSEQPDDRTRGLPEGVDHLGEVVLQELLAVGGEAGDDLLVVEGVGAHESEVEGGFSVEKRNAAHAIGDGPVLRLREGLRVDHGEDDPSVGGVLVLLQEVADPRDVAGDRRQAARERARDVQAQGHRLVDPPDDVAGALGEGEQPLLGKIEPEPGEGLVGEHVQGEERRHREHDPANRVGSAAHVLLLVSSLLASAAVVPSC